MRVLFYLVVLSSLGAGGCWTLPSLWSAKNDSPPDNSVRPTGFRGPDTPVRPPEKPHALVTADQVDEKNAHVKCQALREEMDLDEQGGVYPPPPAVSPAGKP